MPFRKTLIIVLFFAAPLSADGGPVSLRQIYEWARQESPDLKIRAENIQQAQARARAAIGTALPQISWNWANTWQEPSGVEALERRGFTGFAEKEQEESKFRLEQALFSGLREFSAMSGFKRESLRDQLNYEWASRELYFQTAALFYRTIAFETDYKNTNETYLLSESRTKELRDFMKLGKARESEFFTARAYSAGLKARLEQIQSNINASREQLSYLTGRDLSTAPLIDDMPDPVTPESLEQALAKAQHRTDLRAQREEVMAKKLAVRYERGSYWPTADVSGNYYTNRATFLKDIDWDVVLALDVPIYQGGSVKARVKEALSVYRQALFVQEDLEDRIVYQVRRIHGQLSAAVGEVVAFQEAAQAARQSYRAQHKEYKYGLVTNLDVLQALDASQTQQNAYDGARLRAKALAIELGVATEQMP